MDAFKYFIVLASTILTLSCTQRTVPGSAEPWRISPADAKAAEPAAASAPDGGVYLTYVEHRPEGSNVFLQALDADGRPKGERGRE